ncbi:MAG: hypothetical protein Q8K32_09050 [Archangium sp.]|nr:hypothetical protein [Archangium sp.]
MKLRFCVIGLAALLACTSPSGVHNANLAGTHDLVLVGDPANGFLAETVQDGGVTVGSNGVPSRFLFVTSTDLHQLHILENFQTTAGGRSFVEAANPLETLSIPVLDRPSMLAADEGRNKQGLRVTGGYVYAARPGGAEVSVVSVAQKRQVGGAVAGSQVTRPMAAPAPVTAIGAFMVLDPADAPLETRLPTTTRLFTATWDGANASIFSASLPTNPDALNLMQSLPWERELLVGPTPVAAMVVVAPRIGRSLDGAPFCATSVCLAVATRESSGLGGQSYLLDPDSGASATLSFSGPVRKLVVSGDGSRVYGVLEEQACGSPACGGIVAVDIVTATRSTTPPYRASFPASLDALGLPWRPLRAGDGLITGLTVASGGAIMQAGTNPNDGGLDLSFRQQYNELGAFSSSTGLITFFSGFAGSVIDYDPRRSLMSAASARIPGQLPDGGESLIGEDGGAIGSSTALAVNFRDVGGATYRVSDAPLENADGGTEQWTFDISDGYLETQAVAFVFKGQIPGLVSLPTTAADGVRLNTGGLEARAAVGDIVRFETGTDNLGYLECGRSTIAAIGAGFIEAAEAPATCASRVRFSVRADGAKPLVVVADLEGYLGRWAPGETLTYNRPYVLLPAEVTSSRTALTVNIPQSVPRNEGASTTFQVNGYIAPYQSSIDTLTIGCYAQLPGQVVLGNMVMDQVPTRVSGGAISLRWTVMAAVPSGNGIVEIPLEAVGAISGPRLGALSTTQGAFCWR